MLLGVAIRFGAFAAFSVVATVSIAQWIGGRDGGGGATLTATFQDVTGLRVGDSVRLAGVPVGSVTKVTPVLGRAEVRFTVEDGVSLPVDTVVEVGWRNLLGDRILALRPGTAPELLGDGDTVERTRKAVDLGELVNRVGPLLRSVDPRQLNTIIQALSAALEGNTSPIQDLVADFGQVLATVAQRDGTIRQLLDDLDTLSGLVAQRDGQLQTVIDNLALLAQEFDANGDLLDRALDEISAAASGLDGAIGGRGADLDTLVRALAELTGLAADRIDILEDTLARLPAGMRSLFSLTDRGELASLIVVCSTFEPPPAPCTLPNPTGPVPASAATGSAALERLIVGPTP